MDDIFHPRSLEPALRQAGKQFPVVLVMGPRQVGKTTLLRHMSRARRNYVTLDDPQMVMLAREDPSLFLQRFKPPLLIDEIQYAPGLLPLIKKRVDEQKMKNAYWLTGSQQFHLMKGVSESLAGRVGIVNLLGFSLKELKNRLQWDKPFLPTDKILHERLAGKSLVSGIEELYQIIWRGSYPGMWIKSRCDRDLFYSSYVQTYLQRDVRDLAQVGDEMSFLKFLRAAAARTGQLLNLAEMARDATIAPSTAQRWLSILQASGMIYLLEPFHTNVTKRLIKSPKLYFLDTGLCAYLTEWSSPQTLEAGAMSGAVFETFSFTEILKSYWHHGKRAPFYYYRDKDQKEVDLLIFKDDVVYPIEIKKTASPHPAMIGNFFTLRGLRKSVAEGALVCLCEKTFPLSNTVNAIPVGIL